MKMKYAFILTLLLLVIFPAAITSGKDTFNQWKGSVETKNGITLVKNTDKPLFGRIVLETKEDLVLKYGRDEDDVFGDIIAVDLDKEDNIYILDSQRLLVTSFGKNGKFRFQFGSKGARPAEFEDVRDMFISKNGNINVLDPRIIQIFDRTGKPLRQFKLNHSCFDFFINEKNQYIISFYTFNKDVSVKELVAAYSTSALKTEKELGRYPLDKIVKRKLGQGFMFYNVPHDYQPAFWFARSLANKCVFGFSNDYKLKVVDENGHILKIIENAEKAVDISSKERQIIHDDLAPRCKEWPKQVFEETLQFPKQRPFFQKILVDDIGRIFVQRVRPVQEGEKNKKEPHLFDVYDQEGRFIYQAQLPVSPNLIRNGYLYYIDTISDEDEIFVKRCKITNWQALKTSVIGK